MIEKDFLESIEEVVKEYVTRDNPWPRKNDKAYHDALWGTHYLQAHEVAVVDLPLIQRLRHIKQTGFTNLIYPSATHSRFEHTLGVMFQAQKLISALSRQPEGEQLIRENVNTIRMAALLHDCGHGPMSHTSEEIYKNLPDMQKLVGEGGDHEGCNPHEILSYYIVKSETFKEFFWEVMEHYGQNIDIDDVASIIIGDVKNPLSKYITDTINGPFDADKLDYLFRDGHFSGLPLTIDLDRLWYSVRIESVNHKNKKIRMLVMVINGTTPLEQILFSKMVLFTSVYQHHKVRTCDCMLKAIIQYCRDENREFCGRKLERSTDFLWLTDSKLFAQLHLLSADDPLYRMIYNLAYRKLLKRALIISKSTVKEQSKEFFGYSTLKRFSADLLGKDIELRKLAQQIWEEAGKPCDLLDVWIDLPKVPPIGAADDIYINIGTHDSPNHVKMVKVFRVDDWAQDYVEHKWRGHVFCPANTAIRGKISSAAKKVLESSLNIQFEDLAVQMCNIE